MTLKVLECEYIKCLHCTESVPTHYQFDKFIYCIRHVMGRELRKLSFPIVNIIHNGYN